MKQINKFGTKLMQRIGTVYTSMYVPYRTVPYLQPSIVCTYVCMYVCTRTLQYPTISYYTGGRIPSSSFYLQWTVPVLVSTVSYSIKEDFSSMQARKDN